MNPGTTMPPRASITRVSRPTSLRISDVDPTAVMRSPVRATACAHGLAGSPVHTTPFTIAIVAVGDLLVFIEVAQAIMAQIESGISERIAKNYQKTFATHCDD